MKAFVLAVMLATGCVTVDRSAPPVREREADVVLANRAVVRELLRERARDLEGTGATTTWR